MKLHSYALIAGLLAAASGFAADINIYPDSLGQEGKTYSWTKNNTYILRGFIFVKDRSVLNIEAGTVIKGWPGQAANASALIVCRGGRIYARGTQNAPIIFTCQSDVMSDPWEVGSGVSARGLWGGIVLLGRAPNNLPGQVKQAEGIPATYGDLIRYGDPENDVDQTTGLPVNPTAHAKNTHDTTGVMQYVQIRYPGTAVENTKEINGLTFYSVGKGTTIDHIEVFNSADDAFEWFGGTVDCKYLAAIFEEDDAFDYDQGYTGRCQYLFALQSRQAGSSNRLGEFDSDDCSEADGSGTATCGRKPYSLPVWYNCTFLGSGRAAGGTKNDYALLYKENAGGTIVNSIVGDFVGTGVGMIEGRTEPRFLANDIMIKNNIFFLLAQDSMSRTSFIQDSLKLHQNLYALDTPIVSINRMDSIDAGIQGWKARLDPRPRHGSPALVAANAGTIPGSGGFFEQTDYLGAFSTSDLWISGWTRVDELGILTTGTTAVQAPEKARSMSAPGLVASAKSRQVSLSFSLPTRRSAHAELYDLTGKRVVSVLLGTLEAGMQTVAVNTGKLAGGYYLVRLVADDMSIAQGLTISK